MADPIPSPGDPSTLFERLRTHLGRYDPELVARIAGATDATIERYAEISGLGDALPPSYRSFVVGMGENDGGLFADWQIDTRLISVVELYEEREPLCPDLPVAALFVIGDQVSFDRRSPANDPSIVATSEGELVRPLSASWESFAMQAAILRVERRRLPHARWHSSSATTAAAALAGASATDVIAEFAADLGLSLAWPSDDWHRIAVAERQSLFVNVASNGACLVQAFATSEPFMRRVADDLAPRLGATQSGASRGS